MWHMTLCSHTSAWDGINTRSEVLNYGSSSTFNCQYVSYFEDNILRWRPTIQLSSQPYTDNLQQYRNIHNLCILKHCPKSQPVIRSSNPKQKWNYFGMIYPGSKKWWLLAADQRKIELRVHFFRSIFMKGQWDSISNSRHYIALRISDKIGCTSIMT